MSGESLERLARRIEAILGHPPAEPRLLEEAVTHRSLVNESGQVIAHDNERLEFLGDAVLSLIVSEKLMSRYGTESEGMLSKFRSSIVNERSLAHAARAMDLGAYVRLGKGEEYTRGREKDSILADTFEAVVAALYLAGGLKDAVRFVEHHFSDMIDRVRAEAERHDSKTALQEWTQRLRGGTPVYRLVSEEGPDHEKTFETVVEIDGRVYGRGRGGSKKVSEQLAADEALKVLRKEEEEKPAGP